MALLRRDLGGNLKLRADDLHSSKRLDGDTRQRRLKKQLEALEQDNFQDDPHANLTWHKKIPKFDESPTTGSTVFNSETKKRKEKRKSDHLTNASKSSRFKRTFQQLLEEEEQNREDNKPNYFTAQAPPSSFPPRHFCAICGFTSLYTCVQCGARYCCVKCLTLHKETRCLKWTV